MIRARWTALALLLATPVWPAAKKISIAELKDMLYSLHQQNKSDADVADALKQVQLTEALSRSTMNGLASVLPAQLSTEQIYVLEARSAMLPPPPGDIPDKPALDDAAQQALLTKAEDYVSKTYTQTPAIIATRSTLRFQDNVQTLAPSSGVHGSARDATLGAGFVSPNQFVKFINASDAVIAIEHGLEKLPEDKTRWGGNGMIALKTPDPSLAQIWSESKDAATMKWIRWEFVNGKPAGVFAFQVPKKKSRLALQVCCFPKIDQASSSHALPGAAEGGSFQTNTEYEAFKTVAPYYGELFLDPDSGIVVRLIVQAELKSSDVVHQLDTRVDYGPVTIGGKSLVLPIRTIVDTEVVPYGESGGGSYHTLATLFISEFKNHQFAGATASK